MKALEAFSPKDIRTCARVLSLLAARGLDLSDLHAHAEHMRLMAGAGHSLTFKNVDLSDLPETSILDGLGWETLRKWQRIKILFEKQGILEHEIKAYTRAQRKRALQSDRFGWFRY